MTQVVNHLSNLEKVTSINNFISKVLHYEEDQYEARKIEQLLDAYKDQLVAEIKIDAVLTDIAAGVYTCQIGA